MNVIVDVSVATIDAEIAHHGTWRPPRKYWAVVFWRRAKKTPAATTPARYRKTMTRSSGRTLPKSYQLSAIRYLPALTSHHDRFDPAPSGRRDRPGPSSPRRSTGR